MLASATLIALPLAVASALGDPSSQTCQDVSEIIDSSGDKRSALSRPSAIAINPTTAEVYVAGRDSANVFRVRPDGTKTEVISSLGAGRGKPLVEVTSLAVGPGGELFVAGGSGNNAFLIRGTSITQIIDASGDGVRRLEEAQAIAVDGLGRAYVAGRASNNVFRITLGSHIEEIIDATGDGALPLSAPVGLAADATGNVFVAANLSHNAFRIGSDNSITEIIGGSGDGVHPLRAPAAIATDHLGRVYVAGSSTDNAFRIEPDSSKLQIIDSTANGVGALQGASAIAVDGSGNAYVAGSVSQNVFKVTPEGTTTQVIDRSGQSHGESLLTPSALASSPGGNVYVAGFQSDNALRLRSGTGSTIRNGTGVNPVGFLEIFEPYIGLDWIVTVDITTPGALSSVVSVSANGPTIFPLPLLGELLCQPPFLQGFSYLSLTEIHHIPIPADPNLAGVSLCAQATTITNVVTYQLQNALDLTIGVY